MAKDTTITLYGAPWCAFCHMAKEYFKSKHLEFKDIDVDEDPNAARELVAKTGQAGIPVIEIGDATIIGFDRPKIDSALEQYNLV